MMKTAVRGQRVVPSRAAFEAAARAAPGTARAAPKGGEADSEVDG
jgi:formylglycine-generating enzyme required for sulfatase activity